MKKSLWKLILQLHAEGDGGDGGTGGGSPAAGNPGGGDPNSDGAGGGAPGAGNGGGNPAGNPPGNENGFRKNPFGDGNPDNQQKPVIPDKYEFKLAEGLEIAPAVAEEFTGIAKELGLTQAGVDKLVDLHGRLMLESVKQAEAQRDTWAEECAKQGLATPQAMANAKLAVDTFGGGEAMNILVQTGAAWHPAIQKMLQNIGSLLQEDNTPDGKPAGKQPSAADMMFPNSKYE
ncbi:MAG: hypothetical protein IJ858_00655 [Acidaminococcaceae bacterium]|nr:hypothetical protein [Acidaminococcaceae bacterium]MBR2181930.1 hypothetical protein [Acidaminococcaceae bacterium]